MNGKRAAALKTSVLVAALSLQLFAQTPAVPAEPDYKLLNAISQCSDVNCVKNYREQVGNSKLSKTVFYEKWFLLEHSRVAAEGLLHSLPESPAEQGQLMALGDWHENGTGNQNEIEGLAGIYRRWPRAIADAVTMVPEHLPEYIRYGLLAPNDPHSDYAGNEERVCHADPTRFQFALARLDRKTQAYIRRYVFNPEKCSAIFISEGD
jgi:hypothetical protein